MEQITYKNLVDKITELFPEYKNSSKYFDESNKELPYIMLGGLSSMVFEGIDEKKDVDLAERLIRLTDEIINNPHSEKKLVNLFQIEVFETMVGSRVGAILAKKYLHGKSINALEQTLKGFGTKEFEEEYRKV